jgi:6-phosphogluconate dehydrogenase
MALNDFGIIGTAVMGRNLALNILDHGFSVSAFNLEQDLLDRAVKESNGRLVPTKSLEELVKSLERPRRILMMIKAGSPVDSVLEKLLPILDPADVVIDGGNSWFPDTQRRELRASEKGVNFVGIGVSGGEEGARNGPSLMPGGKPEAYERLKPILEAIAAKTDSGSCVTYCGKDGAGHFVKMVHNGIEYADMQFIAEAYDVLARLGGLTPPELGQVFSDWNKGPLESFLIEITAKIFTVKDPKTQGYLVDQVLDQAGQKGTGKWTAQVALDLGVSVPSIAASIDARVLSSMKPERKAASQVLKGPSPKALDKSARDALIRDVHDALYAAKVGAYAQGMALIAAGSAQYGWNTNLKEVARIWKGGCIIRAQFLDTIRRAYDARADLPNLLLDPQIREGLESRQGAWRRVVTLALEHGIPVPGMSASLGYYDSYRSAELPQNLTQAQRDAFGAHTYQRKDDPTGPFMHSEWLSSAK